MDISHATIVDLCTANARMGEALVTLSQRIADAHRDVAELQKLLQASVESERKLKLALAKAQERVVDLEADNADMRRQLGIEEPPR